VDVFFDYQVFYLQRAGGISRYFLELARALKNVQDCDPLIVAPFHANDLMKEKQNEDYILTYGDIQRKLYYNRLYDLQEQRNEIVLDRLVRKSARPLIHETFYTHRSHSRAPKVTTVHDMIYELSGGNSEEERWNITAKKKAVEEADLIIAVSENTKRDLINFYPSVKDKIQVVHHGVSPLSASGAIKYIHPAPYILFVGKRAGYKNFGLLLQAYASDKELFSVADIISFGGEEVSEKEVELIKKLDLKEKVHFLRGDDKMLQSLYRGAEVLAYLSSYEGFGMPVLEAMFEGCPVLCSDRSSLPEVAGGAALMTDVKNEGAIAGSLKRMLNDLELRKSFSEKGRRRASGFTWDICAKNTFECYRRILG
jgi:glycosyltransferase involved in cell wall biosynthesis